MKDLLPWALPVLMVLAAPATAGAAFLPPVFAGGTDRVPLADQSQFEVHLVKTDDFDSESIVPTGEETKVPDGQYLVWVEGDQQISVARLVYSIDPSEVPLEVKVKGLLMGMNPAGTVSLTQPALPAKSNQVRLLSLESHLHRGSIRPIFWRRSDTEALIEKGTLLPVGQALAALCNPSTDKCDAISLPISINAETDSPLKFHRPSEGSSDLLVRIHRPESALKIAGNSVSCAIVAENGDERLPDVITPSPLEVFAVWYNVPYGHWNLKVDAEALWLGSVPISIRGPLLHEVDCEAKKRPTLSVEFDLLQEFSLAPVILSVLDSSTMESVAIQEFEEGLPSETSFEKLNPVDHRLTLSFGPWTLTKDVDLKSGNDQRFLFTAEIARIDGEVTKGGEPYEATLRFWAGSDAPTIEDSIQIKTNESGQFSAALLPEYTIGRIEVEAPGGRGTPYWVRIDRMFRDGEFVRVEIPDNAINVIVTDSSSGQPIEGATVSYSLTEEADETGGMRKHVSSTRTNQGGETTIFATDPGDLEISANALGYEKSRKDTLVISAETEPQEVFFALNPEGETADLVVELPNGSPASGARVLMFEQEGFDAIFRWSGTADSGGRVGIPSDHEGEFLCAIHENASFKTIRWHPPESADAEPVRICLPPSAGRLWLRTIESNGVPAPKSMISLWFENMKIPSSLMSWLGSGVPPVSDWDGLWYADFLPAGQISVLAWVMDRGLRGEILAGAYDYRAQTFSLPSNQVIEIERLEP